MKEIFSTISSQSKPYAPYVYRGLKGRYGHWPAANSSAKRTFVVVYGQHASLERIGAITAALRQYGDVYAVDNPGFGGMEASYRIKERPTLDFYAGHLEHFIQSHVPKDRALTILGISYGFQMVTKLLASYPETAKRTESAVSFVGFVKYDNLHVPFLYKHLLINFLGGLGNTRAGSKLLNATVRPGLVKGIYKVSKPINVKVRSMPRKEAKRYAHEQALLWTINDHRTHSETAFDFLKRNDLTDLRVQTALMHLGVPQDHLLDNQLVSEQVSKIYEQTTTFELHLENHAPLDIDTAQKVAALIPNDLKQVLKSSINPTAVLS